MISKNPHMLNDAAEMFSDSAKHLFGIYMLFVIMLYLGKEQPVGILCLHVEHALLCRSG